MTVEAVETSAPARMTTLQGMIVSGVSEGLSVAEAGRQAGIPDRRNAWTLYDNARKAAAAELAKWGVDSRAIALKIRAKMSAKETKFFQKDGRVIEAIDVEAHGIQLAATELAADIIGLRDAKSAGASIGTVNILWAGQSPPWASQASGDTDAKPNQSLTVNATVHTDNLSVIDSDGIRIGNKADADARPTSAVEGTEPDPPATTHIHSAKSAAKGVLTQRSSEAATASAAVLTQRVKQKRKPRLPVYRGEK